MNTTEIGILLGIFFGNWLIAIFYKKHSKAPIPAADRGTN